MVGSGPSHYIGKANSVLIKANLYSAFPHVVKLHGPSLLIV